MPISSVRRAHARGLLLADSAKNDALLLRLALREVVADKRNEFADHRRELAVRFAAVGCVATRCTCGEARFRPTSRTTFRPRWCSKLWNVQREPADLRILAAAARASGESDARRTVTDWLASTRLEDVAVVALAERRAP
jgi:hypothetical protein